MTKKDFILIAAALKSARVNNSLNNPNKALYNNGVDNATSFMADALATTNPLFDRARFLAACGVPS
jgi:hypothetical protein